MRNVTFTDSITFEMKRSKQIEEGDETKTTTKIDEEKSALSNICSACDSQASTSR